MIKLNTHTSIREEYKDCTVEKVTKVQEVKNIHIIHLSVPGTEETIAIGIQNSFDNIIYQLEELKEGRRNRCHFAKGLTNIDIVKDENKEEIYIVESLREDSYSAYQLKSFNEIESLIESIQEL